MHLFRSSSSSGSRNDIGPRDSNRQTKEYEFENFEGSIDTWRLPKLQKKMVYRTSNWSLLPTNYVIKTEERDLQICKPLETIQLLSQKSLAKHIRKGFNYIHLGLVQVGFKSLTREGLNTSILAVLRDARMLDFTDSLIGTVESSLCSGPIFFNCFPNFAPSLTDPNIMHALTLQVKTHGYHMLPGSVPVAIIYRIHYKVAKTSFGTEAIRKIENGETLVLQTDLTRSNTVIPKTIKWNEIELPEEWTLDKAQPAQEEIKEPDIPKPNTNLNKITQFEDGTVKLSFRRNPSLKIRDDTSTSSTISLGNVSNLPRNINLEDKIQKNRDSVGQTPRTSISGANYQTRIPKANYQKQKEKEPEQTIK